MAGFLKEQTMSYLALVALVLSAEPTPDSPVSPASPSSSTWTALGPGVGYSQRSLERSKPARLHVVRVDPRVAKLTLGIASRDGRSRTAAEWADELGLVVAINAGMFEAKDHRTHVGRLVDGAHVDQGVYNRYQSALLVTRKRRACPKPSWWTSTRPARGRWPPPTAPWSKT
jgi:hypothetical protein